MKTLLATLFVMAVGVFAVFSQTEGFTVLTTESARRASVIRQPIHVTNADLVSASNQHTRLMSLLSTDDRVAIVNFIYTRCPFVCVAMGEEFQHLEQEIIKQDLSDTIRLISISFDERDTPEWLERYQKRMRMDTSVWQAYLAANKDERISLLNVFGIVVIPAPLGQFEHNAAYHIVTPDGLIRRIIDIGSPEHALYYAVQAAKQNPRLMVLND